jgi:hypothetical protein
MKHLLLAILLLPAFLLAQDNEITIEQTSGNYFDLNVVQVGDYNIIKMYDTSSYVSGNNVELTLIQENSSGTNNVIELWHLSGTDNTIRWAQGTAWDNATSTTYGDDGNEGGGHYARLDIHGNYNHLQGHQTNQGSTSGHTFTSLIFSSYNDIWLRQQGDGAKTISLQTNNDYNDISVLQKGNWAEHTANITLSGSYGTTLDLRQQGTTSQSYSLTQSCVTAGGCSVSVTQGQ